MNAIQGTRPLGSLVQEYTQLTVEDYQRPYTWESEQIEDYFDDLKESVREVTHHFFGTLILQTSDQAGRVLVVDGQQRLTTTVVLISYLRDKVLALSTQTIPGDAQRVETYVPGKVYSFLLVNNDKLNPRFAPNRTIRNLMNDCVFKEERDGQRPVPKRDNTAGASTLKFRKATQLLRKKVDAELENLSDIEKLIKIDNFLEAILNRFHVLKVDTSSPGESLDIFLTLNNRGAALGPSDLVRGEVLKRLGANMADAQIETIHRQNLDSWNTIVEQVKDPDVYLRHYLVATGKPKVQKKKIVDTVVKRISPQDSSLDEQRELAQQFWLGLATMADFYSEIVSPLSETSSLTKFTKEYILLLEGLMKSHRILILSLMKVRPTDEDFEETVRLIFVYGFRYYMNGGNAQDLENRFQDWGQTYQSSKSVEALQEKLKIEIRKNTVDSTSHFSSEADADYITRALLHIVNRYQSVKIWPLQDYHLEHIAPQTSTNQWVTELGAGTAMLESDYNSANSELGNLTLLDPETNWKIKNWSFAKKKVEYARGDTNITHDLTSVEYWTREEIARRGKWLCEMFDQIWNESKPNPGTITQYSAWQASDPIKG
jgi:hypothetical protein